MTKALTKNEFTQLAKTNNVAASFSGSTGTMHIKGGKKAVDSFVIKANLKGKAVVPFTLAKEYLN